MQITHVKIKTEVTISYQKPAENGGEGLNTYKLISKEEPTPEFKASLQALAPFIPVILDLPGSYADTIIIKGITIVYKGDAQKLGFTISASRPVAWSNSPANINTPLVYEEDETELPVGLFEGIKNVIDKATDYVNGERAEQNQKSLFYADTDNDE